MPNITDPNEPYDWPLRWLIKSHTTPGDSYMVDLGMNDCIGMCTCKWATRTMIVQIREKKQVQVCQHIIEADIKFKKWCKRRFKDLDPNPEDAPPPF